MGMFELPERWRLLAHTEFWVFVRGLSSAAAHHRTPPPTQHIHTLAPFPRTRPPARRLAWCLPTGLQSIVPYFYALYFLALLLHRDRRDDAACRLKYGRDWDKFCGIVKYRMFPLIY